MDRTAGGHAQTLITLAALTLGLVVAPLALATPGAHPSSSTTSVPIWTQLHPVASPPASGQAAMAYDPALKEVVLFGGDSTTYRDQGDTWTYKAGVWTNISSTLKTSPPGRWAASFEYDPKAKALVLFGGRAVNRFFNDTWLFTSQGWSSLGNASGPSPRALAAMAWDPVDKSMVLYGGGSETPAGAFNAWTTYSDTWEFKNHRWTDLTGRIRGSIPGNLSQADFGYLASLGKMMLVGGWSSSLGYVLPPGNATFLYRSGVWGSSTVSIAPPPEDMLGSFAWDPTNFTAITFGGEYSSSGVVTNDTWHLGRGGWTNETARYGPPPSARDAAATAWDGADGYFLLFGGNSQTSKGYLHDTWSLK